MTPAQQTLVRDSFAKVAPIAPAAAAMFYDRPFVLDPALRPLFKGNMTEQGRELMAMIGAAVANLHRLEDIVPPVWDLGKRHAGYAEVTTPLPALSHGRSNKARAPTSLRRHARPGPHATACSPAK